MWLRPFRNLVYTMPPYVTSDEDLATITDGHRAVPSRRCTDERVRDWLAEQARRAGGRRPDPPAGRPGTRRSRCIDLAGNDYLGLARDPRGGRGRGRRRAGVRRRGRRLPPGHRHAARPRGARARAAPTFTGFPTALVFSTGYHANLSVVSALADADTLIVSDAHVHASLIDACRLSRAAVHGRAAQRRRRRATARWPAAPSHGRWCSSRRSTRSSATPRRWPSWPRSARRTTPCSSPTRRTRLGVAGLGGRGLLHAAGLAGPSRRGRHPDPDQVARRPGRRGARPHRPSASTWSTGRGRSSTTPGSLPPPPVPRWRPWRVVEAEPDRVARVNEIAARAGRGLRGRRARRRGAGGADAGPARGARRGREGRRERRTHRLLPSALHPRRDLPAPAHRPRAARRRRARPGGRRAARTCV